jgi:hypothetical protein
MVSVMSRLRTGLTIGLIALSGLACAGQTFVDGLPIGDRVEGDARFTEFALAALDGEDPDHAPMSSVEMYVPDYRNRAGEKVLVTRGGGGSDRIVVLNLSDGSRRALYVACGVGLDEGMCFLGPPDYLLQPD